MRLIDINHNQADKKLQAYLSSDSDFKKIFEHTRKRFKGAKELKGHNWAHIYRDVINVIVIGEAENADMSIVLPAMTMHDIGFLYAATGRTHGAIGADNAKEYIDGCGVEYPEEKIRKISDCIRTHKGSMHNEKPESLEAKVVADADLMEKFGPIGVYQCIRAFTEFDYTLEKILARREVIMTLSLETETGKRLAEPGRKFVQEFFSELWEATRTYGDVS